MKEISLNKETLKALAVESRVKILKLLLSKKHTQSDLSRELKLTIPAVKEHLDYLEKTGLVERIEDGRKWKYYNSTEKSKSLFNSEFYKLVIALGVFGVSAGLSLILSFRKTSLILYDEASKQISNTPSIAQESAIEITKQEPILLYFVLIILILSMIFTILFWFRYRKIPYEIVKSLP